MSIKTHLYDSAEPAKEGSKLLAICGAIVPDAAFVAILDGFDLGSQTRASALTEMLSIGTCAKCRKTGYETRYLYLIRSGEEQKQSEAEAS